MINKINFVRVESSQEYINSYLLSYYLSLMTLIFEYNTLLKSKMKHFWLIIMCVVLLQVQSFNFRQVSIISASSSTINTYANYRFRLDRTTDNTYRQTAYKTQQVNLSSTTSVTFPNEYTSIATVTCLSLTVDDIAVNTFGCTISGNTVTFTNAFTSISNLFIKEVIIMIGNVLNPSPALYTGTFSGYIGIDYAEPTSIGFQLSAGFLSQCSVTFTPGLAFLANSIMVISIKPANDHPQGTTLRMTFPRAFWTNDITNQAFLTTSLTCHTYTNNINTGIQCVGNTNNNQITVSNIFSTVVNTRISFGINNFLSPPSNQPSDAISIVSYVGINQLDACTVYPSGLTPSSFNNFTIVPLSTMVVNRQISLRFDMNLAMSININDYFSVKFPDQISFRYVNVFGTGFYLKPPTISNKTVFIYHDKSINAPSYNKNSNYSFTLAIISSPPSTLTTSPITVEILRNGYPIMVGSSTLKAVTSILNATLAVANKVVWALTSYTFTINIANGLSSDGMIQIILPETVTIGVSSTNCAVVVGSNLATNPLCTINNSTNTIRIYALNLSSSAIASQNNIRVTINNLINPIDTATTGPFSITTYYSSNNLGLVDVGTVTGFTSSVGTIDISTVSVVPSSYRALQAGVDYTINFKNTYLIPEKGYILIQIPTNISILMTSLFAYCKLSINDGAFISTSCSGTSFALYNLINFTNPAGSQSIIANSRISLQISQLCTNPSNTGIVTNFTISTFSKNGAIESLSSSIIVQMTIPANFNTIQVRRDSQQNSAITTYRFQLRQQAALPSGSILLINFPSDISMNSNSSCTDGSNLILICTTIGYQNLQITLGSVAGNNEFLIVITNIRNPASYKPTSQPFTFKTKTSDQISTYAEGQYSAPLSNSVPTDFQYINRTFSPAAYASPQTLTITIIPSSNILPRSLIINLASSFTVNSLSCGSFIGFTGVCSIVGINILNITGTIGISQISFTISGFTSPSFSPNDFTIVNSYDSEGFLIDQNSNKIKYTIGCTLPCKSCSSNTSACLSCYNNSNISQFNIYNPIASTCVLVCQNGYFSDPTLTCILCSSICLTCNIASSNCTSCNSNSSYPALNKNNNKGECLPSCPSKFYLNNQIYPSQCTGCVQPCLTCQSETSCLSCTQGYFYYNFTCAINCPNNITIPNNASRQCEICAPQCATCLGSISNCSSCNINAASYNGQCLTVCPFPLVINAGTCANCNANCKTCSLISTNCTSCYPSSSNSFLLVTVNYLGSCLNKCPFTYYGDSINGECKLCNSLNIGCSNCSSTTTCYNCDVGSSLIYYNSQCINYIPIGFYNQSGKAQPCNSSCSSCFNSANNCTSCVSLSLSHDQCVSNCPSGQVSINKICSPCKFPCLSCFNLDTNCTFCNSTSTDPYYLSSGNCLKTCPLYTYQNPINWICSTCVQPCQLCSSVATCITCSNGFNIFNNTCKQICPIGFVGLNKICETCTNNCSQCLGSRSYCLSCIAGNYLYNTSTPSCSTNCPTGLYINLISQICVGCQLPCLTCSQLNNNCTTCRIGLYLQNFRCLSVCSIGYYKLGNICKLCNLNCTRCSSQLICESCIDSLVLSGSTCVSVCPLSTPIINNARICSSCTDIYCINCNSSNYCSYCFYPKLTFRGTCINQNQCPTSYIPDSNLTTCIYNPNSANQTIQQILTQSLQTTSIFPVPFTISAAFVTIASLMSKFQYTRTNLVGSLYSILGLLQFGAIILLLVLEFVAQSDMTKLSLLLIGGGLIWIYTMNLIFLIVQNYSLRNDKRLKMWLEGSINSCWYTSVSILSLFTTNKFKQILFCKLFNFRVLSIKLDEVGKLRVFYIFTFVSVFSSLATIAGSAILLIDSKLVVNQLLMSYIDVIVLSVIQLILGFINVQKDEDFFQDIDQDGLQINKRIQIRDQEQNSNIMPSYAEFAENDKRQTLLIGLQSAKKMQNADYLSQRSLISKRDISIQAESILGQRSLISRLGTQQISDFSFFEGKQDVSIQKDEIRYAQDKSIAMEIQKMHDISIGQSIKFLDASVSARELSKHDVSIDQTPQQHKQMSVQFDRSGHEVSIQMDRVDQHEISIQYVPMYTDHTVQMTFDQQQMGIQCNAEQQNISIQYTAKPIFQNLSQSFPSQAQYTIQNQPSDLQIKKKLIENLPAQHQKGMTADIQIDIEEKLERKKKDLQFLKRKRLQRQKEESISKFKRQMSLNQQKKSIRQLKHNRDTHREDVIQEMGNQTEQIRGNINYEDKKMEGNIFRQQNYPSDKEDDDPHNYINEKFNNQISKQESSQINSKDELIVHFPVQSHQESQVNTQKNFIQMLENSNKKIEKQSSFTLEKRQNFKLNVQYQQANRFIEDEDIIDDQDYEITRNYQLVDNDNLQQRQASNNKSNSTAHHTHAKPPLPRRTANILESSNNSINHQEDYNQSIINKPIHPKYQNQNIQKNIYEKQSLQHKNRINLSQFLDKKQALNSSDNYKRKNHFMEEDALTRQIDNQIHQKPLPHASLETFKTEQARNFSSKINQVKTNDLQRQMFNGFEFDNNDRVFAFNEDNEQLMMQKKILQGRKSLNKQQSNPRVPKSNSKKKMTTNQIAIQRDSLARPSFMRNTYSSEEKRKSLQKIYLNKLLKK